jgi:hypothetical protein
MKYYMDHYGLLLDDNNILSHFGFEFFVATIFGLLLVCHWVMPLPVSPDG